MKFKKILWMISLFVVTNMKAQEINVGDKAKDFSLMNIKGKQISFSSFADAKGFIVIFTCNHCPFSQAYEKRIIALQKKYKKLGYPVIAINPNDKTKSPDDSYEEMIKRAKKQKYNFEYLYDETQEVAKSYGAKRTPHVFVVNKENNDFLIKYIGAIDDNAYEPENIKTKYLELALDNLIAGKSIENPSTKAIGCTIKWK